MFLAFKTAIQAISNISAQEFLDFMTSSCYFWCFKREVTLSLQTYRVERRSHVYFSKIFLYSSKNIFFLLTRHRTGQMIGNWSSVWSIFFLNKAIKLTMATFLQNEESDIPVVGGVASMKHEGLSINHKQRITKFKNIGCWLQEMCDYQH